MPLASGLESILDLNNIAKKQVQKLSKLDAKKRKKAIDKLQKERINRKEYNRKIGTAKGAITRQIRATKSDKIRSGLMKDYKRLQLLPLRDIDNEINRTEGKEFYYTIDDGFNDLYKIKSSTITKEENPSLIILNRYLKGIQESMKGADKDKLDILERLEVNIQRNIDLLEAKERTYETEVIDEARDKDKAYPVFVKTVGSVIKID